MVSIASEIASNKANADAPELGVSTNIRFAGSHKNHKRHNSRQSIEHKASEESVNGKPAIERDEEEKTRMKMNAWAHA